MNAIEEVSNQLKAIGYQQQSVISDYEFSDFLSENVPARKVDLAAFTDYPASYRNAAIGVIKASADPQEQVFSRRALGAPVWLCITDDRIQVWNVHSARRPEYVDERPLQEIESLFDSHKAAWVPDRIHTAKLAGLWRTPEQLSLLDCTLLHEIEHNIQSHLDRTIRKALRKLTSSSDESPAAYAEAYRICFYLLAAKVLQDRSHPVSNRWKTENATRVLEVIQDYYQLSGSAHRPVIISMEAVQRSWDSLTADISYSNISAEDLAFVYENTLVAPETRKKLGTHSTPRAVAEFLVSRLRDVIKGPESPVICEPFCGAAVLLVAALAALKATLPTHWDSRKRHDFLVSKIRGVDCDQFACQVANLSLILADYPNSNGWKISRQDLFQNTALSSFLPEDSVILCNPPFEDFSVDERRKYKSLSDLSLHKPIAVLKAALASSPAAIGFVLPQGILTDSYYREIRIELERYFGHIELVSLPDRVFSESRVESALLIGKNPQIPGRPDVNQLLSAEVTDGKRKEFLRGVHYPEFRAKRQQLNESVREGNLWVPKFSALWDYLERNPTLGSIASISKGVEWKSGYQSIAKSDAPRNGFRRGLASSRGLKQFANPHPEYLDCRKNVLRGNAINRNWREPKVIMNAARKSRGSWRIAAHVDTSGLVVSQQLIGIWVENGTDALLHYISAIINSPIASLFIAEKDRRKRFTLSAIQGIPLPTAANLQDIASLSRDIHALSSEIELAIPGRDEQIRRKLLELDALVLWGYGLPPVLERRVLLHFERQARPSVAAFDGYPVNPSGMALSLQEVLQQRFESCDGDWLSEVFEPLDVAEASDIARFLP